MSTDLIQDRLTGSWTFMPVHSSASFAVKYLVASFRGQFEDVQAELIDGQLKGVVNVASVSVKDENLNTHLQSPDFFDAERHPEISFSSSNVSIDGDQVEVDGELTM